MSPCSTSRWWHDKTVSNITWKLVKTFATILKRKEKLLVNRLLWIFLRLTLVFKDFNEIWHLKISLCFSFHFFWPGSCCKTVIILLLKRPAHVDQRRMDTHASDVMKVIQIQEFYNLLQLHKSIRIQYCWAGCGPAGGLERRGEERLAGISLLSVVL